MVEIVLADDHEVVRSGLRLLLESEAELEVVAEAGNLEETGREVEAHHPQVLVLDLNMPEGPSLPLISALKASSPGTAVVVLTMQNDPAFARAALDAGALAYVLKQAAGTELVDAVNSAARGESYLNPRLRALLATNAASPQQDDELSTREREVLRLIALGNTNAEIGEQLTLSVRTVESHRAHIQQKTGCSSRAELVRCALDRNLLLA